MNSKYKWKILASLPEEITQGGLLDILLKNRGLTTKKEKEAFLYPSSLEITPTAVGIDKAQVTKALKRIFDAIVKKEQIIIFGDYDVDGIGGTAILWETINGLKGNAMPYIPSRAEEGYGLSIIGIENLLQLYPQTKLIITVDNGIVANTAVDFANSKGIEVIITDHHTLGKKVPEALAIVHTTALCGTAVAYMLAQEIKKKADVTTHDDHLALVALSTVADLVPLTRFNRTLLVEGLKILHTTKRPGIVALCEDAKIDQAKIGVYEIGHMLAPRLNATGRITSAMDSLRLLCTKDRLKAKVFAEKIGLTNTERQNLTKELSEHAILALKNKKEDLLFIANKSYEEGVIGLIAGRVVEAYYRPSIVLSLGAKISKASARSIHGFNVIDFIRKAEHLLINAGGHPMAAGFTVYTEKVKELELFFLENIKGLLTEEMTTRVVKIDCELPLSMVSQNVYKTIQQLAPFGMQNGEPLFVRTVKILSVKQIGKDKKHLSFLFGDKDTKIAGIGFGIGERMDELQQGQTVEIVYTIDENEWNNKKSLQLKIKDIRTKK